MDTKYNVGSGGVFELCVFNFDVSAGSECPGRWGVSEEGLTKVLQEVEACTAHSRSLFCMWRVRGEIGEASLSCDTLRSTILSALAGRSSWVSVCYMPYVPGDMDSWFSSLWSVRSGGCTIRGGVLFKKAHGVLQVRFEAQGVYSDVEVSAPRQYLFGKAVLPVHVEHVGPSRCARGIDNKRLDMAVITIPPETSPAYDGT